MTGPADAVTPFSYQILVSLADEARHGYGIIKEIEARNGPGSVPSTGALYLALQRLEESGLIEESRVRAEAGADRRRRYYRLTESGRRAAKAETARLVALVGVAYEKKLITSRQLARAVAQMGGEGER